MSQNPDLEVPAIVGLRIDERSGRLAVQLSNPDSDSGHFGASVQISPKPGSEGERFLRGALTWQQVLTLPETDLLDDEAVAFDLVASDEGRIASILISFSHEQCRYTIDVDARTIRIHQPAPESLLSALQVKVRDLKTFEVIHAPREGIYLPVYEVEPGTQIVINAINGAEEIHTVKTRRTMAARQRPGRHYPVTDRIDLRTDRGRLVFGIGEYVQVLSTPETVLQRVREFVDYDARTRRESSYFELTQNEHTHPESHVNGGHLQIWVMFEGVARLLSIDAHAKTITVDAGTPQRLVRRLQLNVRSLAAFSVRDENGAPLVPEAAVDSGSFESQVLPSALTEDEVVRIGDDLYVLLEVGLPHRILQGEETVSVRVRRIGDDQEVSYLLPQRSTYSVLSDAWVQLADDLGGADRDYDTALKLLTKGYTKS